MSRLIGSKQSASLTDKVTSITSSTNFTADATAGVTPDCKLLVVAGGGGSCHGGGGGGGGGNGCFLPDTPITMADGTAKPVKDVDIGDKVAKGGKVFATGKFLVNNLYDYKGIKVSGSHMVNEDGKWTRVEDSKHGKPLGDDEHIVYVFGAENRRILINNILFTDYFEVPEQKNLVKYGEEWSHEWREYTQKIEKQNVNILNAS